VSAPDLALTVLAVLTLGTFSYATVALLDERIAAKRERAAAERWARLHRQVIRAHADFGGAR
jgi:hypothetical protein